MDISTEIKVMLTRKKKTITWLAEQLNTTQANISNKLRRNDWRINETIQICKLLGYDMQISFIDTNDKI